MDEMKMLRYESSKRHPTNVSPELKLVHQVCHPGVTS